jgi:hypothetical protein
MMQPLQHPSIESDEERRNRERTLDETLEDSFPASDPLSTNPNPDNHGADDREPPVEEERDEDKNEADRARTSVPPRRTAG